MPAFFVDCRTHRQFAGSDKKSGKVGLKQKNTIFAATTDRNNPENW
jgi:hypothetical protein